MCGVPMDATFHGGSNVLKFEIFNPLFYIEKSSLGMGLRIVDNFFYFEE
jgi:hypothetical protein